MRLALKLIGVMTLGLAIPAGATPSQTSGPTIERLKDVITRSDYVQLAAIDSNIEYLPEWKGEAISSDQALGLLRGCTFRTSHTNDWGMTDLKYSCRNRARRPRCSTGNLIVMVYDEGIKTEIGISEDRISKGRCPRVPAPPPVGTN